MALGAHFPDGSGEANFGIAFDADTVNLNLPYGSEADLKYLRRTRTMLANERARMKFHGSLLFTCERTERERSILCRVESGTGENVQG